MNENQKNIETCLPEDILAEVANVPTDAQFRSLVNESLDPLKQQAFEQAGSDAYEQVVQSHQPYTFTSTIVQMKSNLILLLRRLWRFPFGTGTLRSLSDMWQHYIDRLSGNAEYGIPSRLDQLSALPSAPLLVADRKISGVPEAEDGISLVHQLGNSAASNAITEITDDNTGWSADKAGWLGTILNLLPSVTKATFGCAAMDTYPGSSNVACEVHIKTKTLNYNPTETAQTNLPNCDIWLDELETCNTRAQGAPMFRSKRIFFPIFKNGTYSIGGSAGWTNGNTQYIYFGCYGKRTESVILTNAAGGSTGSTQALAILEVRQGARQRIEFAGIPSWDCYPNMTAANIVAYIFDKLADNTYEDDGVTEAPAITIKLGSYLLAKLSAEQIAVATDKNYTVTA